MGCRAYLINNSRSFVIEKRISLPSFILRSSCILVPPALSFFDCLLISYFLIGCIGRGIPIGPCTRVRVTELGSFRSQSVYPIG